MSSIRQLSPGVVNKIAAGEVIERPASVVKELMENSLDARATQVDVSVQKGGIELIRVVDNGSGIAVDELPLAVASHATSKLETADDLFKVNTLGFRGEALASIAEVSQLVLRSRQGSASAAAELAVSGGNASAVAPCGAAAGTTVEVRNLFFNTPVRRKFLRSTQTEMGHVCEAFTRLALAHLPVHFRLHHNDRPVYDLPPTDDWLARIAPFFGQELADDLLWVESSDGPIRLRGYVARPNQSRAHSRMQYLFLNGRYIRDRSLQHALAEAYRGLLVTGRYPISFLAFDMPPEVVDVNVHPTKLEVRFQDGGRLYSQLLGTLRTAFLTSDLTHCLKPTDPTTDAETRDVQQADRMRQELVDWAKGEVAAWDRTGRGSQTLTSAPAPYPPGGVAYTAGAGPLKLARLDRSWAPSGPARPPRVPAEPARPTGSDQAREPTGVMEPTGPAEFDPVRAMQVHNRYLVVESAEGVVVIDQHALHERILYEQLRQTMLSGDLEAQNLLVPEPVDLSAAEAALVSQQCELLARLGVKVEPFGGDTVLVSSYPAMLGAMGPAEVLRCLVDQLAVEGRSPEPRDLVDELLHMISCKAAIKAGDRLTQEEVHALLEQRHLAHDTHHCPHGRPTALVFTREELDRQFKR